MKIVEAKIKKLSFLVLLVIAMFLIVSCGGGGNGGGGGTYDSSSGNYIRCNGVYEEGSNSCEAACGASNKCDEVKPWNRGNCYDGEECNNDCRCEWVDRDLDRYKKQGYDGPIQEAYDCDDRNSLKNPSMVEKCNNVDDNCDGQLDEGDICERSVYVCEDNELCN